MVVSSQVFKTSRVADFTVFRDACSRDWPLSLWSSFSLYLVRIFLAATCLLSYYFATLRRVWLHLYTPFCRQLKTAVTAHFTLSYWEWASQFLQPPLMLYTPVPDCFDNPLLDLVQFFVPWDPKLDTVLQMWLHKYWLEGSNHFFWPGGYCLAITVQHAVGLLPQG